MELSKQSPDNQGKNKYTDPEYLMNSAGSWNRYQGFITVIFIVISIFFTYSHYLPILYLYTPDHHCLIPTEGTGNLTQRELRDIFIPLDNESSYDKCHQYDVDIENIIESGVKESQENWGIVKCKNGWHYEKEDYYESVATEFNLVCENSWKALISEVVYFIGSALGMLLYGWIGDHYGRFWTIMLCNWSVFIFGVILGFSPNFIVYTIIRFIMGISTVNCLTSSFVLSMEYVSKDKRTIIGNFALGVGVALAGFIMPALFYELKHWRLVNHFMFVQGLVTLALPFLLNESIRWLLERQEYGRVAKILQKVSRFNGKELDKNITLNLENLSSFANTEGSLQENTSEKKKVTSIFCLLQKPRLRRNIVLMIILWAMVKLLFETHIRSIKHLGIHVYYSFALANVLELIANIVIIWTMEWFGRRWMTLFCLALSGFPLLVAAYFTMTGGSDLLLLLLSMFARFGCAMVINVVLQFQIEICPTDLRTRISGIILFAGELAAFLSPLVIYSSNIYQILPQLFMGIGGILSGFLGLCLPETTGIDIPANADEGETFGENQNFFYVPILNNLEKKSKRSNHVA